MIASILRIFSVVLLVVAILTMTGAVSTAASLLREAGSPADVCCDLDHGDDDGSGNPCSSPECGCSFCSSAMVSSGVPAPAVPPIPESRFSCTLSSFHPTEYHDAIEYPPELV